MPAFLKKKKEQGKVRRRGVISPSLWLFYLGLISMSLTGVTFSRYSTVVRGTISVKVADSYQVTFLDDSGEEMASCRVYDGQQLSEGDIPEGSNSRLTEDSGISLMALDEESEEDTGQETIIYKKFLGWSLDGETIVDPADITVDGDLCFYAVYEFIEKAVTKATPSNAAVNNQAPQTPGTNPNANQAAGAVPETVPGTTPETVPGTTPETVPGTVPDAAPGTGETPGTGGTGDGTSSDPSGSGNTGTPGTPETGSTGAAGQGETAGSDKTTPGDGAGSTNGTGSTDGTGSGSGDSKEHVIIASSSNATRKD